LFRVHQSLGIFFVPINSTPQTPLRLG